MEPTLVRMSADGFEAFLAAVTAPAQVVPQMLELFSHRAPWDVSGTTD